MYIKSYFIIDLGFIECYLGTFITNVQLFYIKMGSNGGEIENIHKLLHSICQAIYLFWENN